MYNGCMFKIVITKNQANQRLDRFLKKYFNNASLSLVYKLIRKDVKLNGKRVKENQVLAEGDELTLYISDETAAQLQKTKTHAKVKRQFKIAYEDDNILVVEKPFGLLTHGDHTEKKNHLANQVVDYLIEKGDYDPRAEKTFTPAPANRLDRNTTGLVVFGKNAAALQELNRMIREKDEIRKLYLTIVSGRLEKAVRMRARMIKDESKNLVSVVSEDGDGKVMETIARPLAHAEWKGRSYTLVEVEILTGRTHQIRAHLAKAGYPVIGDVKYGDRRVNAVMEKEFGQTTQLLHAYKLVFKRLPSGEAKALKNEENGKIADEGHAAARSESKDAEILREKTVEAQLPPDFMRIKDTIFGKDMR